MQLADYGVGKDDCRHAHAQSSFTRTSEASGELCASFWLFIIPSRQSTSAYLFLSFLFAEKYSTAVNFLPRRFQSRWLGGWAWKVIIRVNYILQIHPSSIYIVIPSLVIAIYKLFTL